jgi:hypothetical protein
MSIKYSGTFRRSGGLISAVIKQVKLVNLRALKRVTVTFDPFHESSGQTRLLLFLLLLCIATYEFSQREKLKRIFQIMRTFPFSNILHFL